MFIFSFSVSTDTIKCIKILDFYKRFSESTILHSVPCKRGFNFSLQTNTGDMQIFITVQTVTVRPFV